MANNYRFCGYCGEKLTEKIPKGDDTLRPWCQNCKVAHYKNPTILVASFLYCDAKLLWTKRGIAPNKGKWAFPAGFVECNESLQQAAARELHEETKIKLPAESFIPMSVSSISPIDQIYMVFRVPCKSELQVELTKETEDWGWYNRASAPWQEMAHFNSKELVEGVYSAIENHQFFMRIGQMTEDGNRHQVYPLQS